ncbi:DNA/RNA helicase domain-containing protein [Variovorax boronicumulans]|uniref:DNA/RNA helicase domain-containing protein n=1 Tax=Variovorax boronicumulans TaxID=436515 RepID=UPI0033915BDB
MPAARDRYDKTLRGHKVRAKVDPEKAAAAADLIIKNTYRTSMTRGIKGCYVYCSDEETARYFRTRLSPGALVAAQP